MVDTTNTILPWNVATSIKIKAIVESKFLKYKTVFVSIPCISNSLLKLMFMCLHDVKSLTA